MFLGAFPVEDTVGVVLESEYLIRDNWLLFSNPKLPTKVVQFAVRKNFHWRGPSIEERVSLAIVGIQSGLFSLSIACDDLDERIIHADVISVIGENICHRQVQGQGTRQLGWFLFQSRFSAHKCIISWGLVRHIARPPNFFGI